MLGVTSFGPSSCLFIRSPLLYSSVSNPLSSSLQPCHGANRCPDHCSQSSRSRGYSSIRYRGDPRCRDRRRSNQLGHSVPWFSQRASCQLCGDCLWLLDWQARSMPCSWRTGSATRNGWRMMSCIRDFDQWVNRRRLAIQVSMPGHYFYSPDHQKHILYIAAHFRNLMR